MIYIYKYTNFVETYDAVLFNTFQSVASAVDCLFTYYSVVYADV